MLFSGTQLVSDKLRERPTDAKIKQAEVADYDPHQGQYAKPLDTHPPNDHRNGDQCHHHGHNLAQEIPHGVAGQQPATGQVQIRILWGLSHEWIPDSLGQMRGPRTQTPGPLLPPPACPPLTRWGLLWWHVRWAEGRRSERWATQRSKSNIPLTTIYRRIFVCWPQPLP